MRYVLERVTNPSIEPVTVAQMITHLREFSSLSADRQEEIADLITTAREWAEEHTGRALVEQSWRLTLDRRLENPMNFPLPPQGWPENGYGWLTGSMPDNWRQGWLLRRSPIIAITSFVSIADDGTETAIDPAAYLLQQPDSKFPRVMGTGGGSIAGDKFAITYRAGFAPGVGSPDPEPDVALVPKTFTQAIKLYAGALYDRDKDMMDKLMKAAESVLSSERIELSMA